MTVDYYNNDDIITRSAPKNHIYFESNLEKYAKIDGASTTDNDGVANTAAIYDDTEGLKETKKVHRKTRNQLLKDSDWTQLADAALTSQQITDYADYRTLLRDITDQSGWPTTINWPVEPVV